MCNDRTLTIRLHISHLAQLQADVFDGEYGFNNEAGLHHTVECADKFINVYKSAYLAQNLRLVMNC